MLNIRKGGAFRNDNTVRTWRFFCPDCGFRIFVTSAEKSKALEKAFAFHDQEQRTRLKEGKWRCDGRHYALS
jgi:hypothetical protein